VTHALQAPTPRRNPLLLLAIVLANLTLGLLLWRVSQLSAQVETLEQSLARETARRDAAESLLHQSLDALSRQDPTGAEPLRVRQKILTSGDPRLLNPQEHPEIKQIFDELL